jgi:predicted heme/steroid binding protein
MEKFKKQELSHYNGKNSAKPYIAYNGIVYDVSDSFHWKDGKHQVFHQAGEDLTEALQQAPHGEDLLKRVPIIGELLEDE